MKKSIFLLLVFVNSLAAQLWKIYDNLGVSPISFYQESDSVYWLGDGSASGTTHLWKFNGDSIVASFMPPQSLNFYTADFGGIAQDTTGKLWITKGDTYPNGVFSFNPIDTTWQFFSELNTNLIPYPAGTGGIIIDNENNLWVTHPEPNTSVSKFNGITWTHYTAANSIMTSDDTNEIEKDDKGRLYFGTTGWISRKTTNTWTNVFYPTACNGFGGSINTVMELVVTPDENDLIASVEGLVIFDSSGNCKQTLQADGVNYKSNFAPGMTRDSKGNIWVCYSGNSTGISKFNGTTWEFFDSPYQFQTIYEDKFEYKLWLLSIYPLVCFYPDSVVSISENNNLPQDFNLKQNFPNPFNPTTTISYKLSKHTKQASLTIFDTIGKEVKKWKPNNSGEVVWDGTDEKGKQVSSGIYFYQLKAGKLQETKKMVFLK